MASPTTDPLLLFRQSIRTSSRIVPVASAESNDEVALSQATNLVFSDEGKRVVLPVDVQSRFMSSEGNLIDLRSIYFAWVNRDITIPEYNAAAEKLNEELAGGKGVHKFPFVERLNLIAWLEGAGEDTEYIKPLVGGDAGKGEEGGKVEMVGDDGGVKKERRGKGTLDPRLAQIYEGERRMGDRNSVLRGIKPTDFSHIRKLAAQFMTRKPTGGSGDIRSSTNISNNPSLALNQKPARRPDPIILLSPSASSLLRMSNAKAFLEGGRYTPPDHSTPPTMLAVSRIIKDMDPNRPIRFILVEGPENFRPEYWNRVVAVFTTGQTWQFKSYKWTNPVELFKHVQGVYLGWRGEQPPESVRAFGHKVLACSVEKWRDPGQPGAEQSRWRDREVVESIWKAIETNMRAKGWRKDAAPTSI
ncbi:accessory factor associated with RNA polymerase II [Podospora bellae-mahoneyi]|uniref:Accessory factor associated with RNA polymerase II n=1 Tax=Podospora bellae-mahoneyi TaxID=2093777 RepID=A0ABR0F8S2_9PEZI|nr:accessory factor associated with RNA polymerase II [Podospora bellae-mahoneyi]